MRQSCFRPTFHLQLPELPDQGEKMSLVLSAVVVIGFTTLGVRTWFAIGRELKVMAEAERFIESERTRFDAELVDWQGFDRARAEYEEARS